MKQKLLSGVTTLPDTAVLSVYSVSSEKVLTFRRPRIIEAQVKRLEAVQVIFSKMLLQNNSVIC